MGKQSLIDGGVEGLGGGILGFINDGTKGAIKGSIGGFVSGAVTGLISGGVSFKFQKPKVSAKNVDEISLGAGSKLDDITDGVIQVERLKHYETLKDGVIDDTAWGYLKEYGEKIILI